MRWPKSLLSIKTLITLTAFLVLGACDVHQFPELNPSPPPLLPKVKVPITLTYQTDFYVWDHNYDPILGKIEEVNPDLDLYPGYPGTSSMYSNLVEKGVVDMYVKVYKSSSFSQPVSEITLTKEINGGAYDHELELELDAGTSYVVAVWAHLRENKDAPAFYDASDFNRIGIIFDQYRGNTDFRDGFSGMVSIETTEDGLTRPCEIRMRRPMGKFELVTVDLSEFLDRETTRRSLATRASADEYNVVISFPYYYPCSYSLFDDRLENAVSGVSFKTKMTVTGTSEASLGFEYVILNDIPDGGVQMMVDIYDPSYTHVAGSSMLTVPMRRDVHTRLKGIFLSSEGEGGIGIDPGFNGDYNIIP